MEDGDDRIADFNFDSEIAQRFLLELRFMSFSHRITYTVNRIDGMTTAMWQVCDEVKRYMERYIGREYMLNPDELENIRYDKLCYPLPSKRIH